MGYPYESPLPGPNALAEYSWPDPDDERITARIYQQADDHVAGDHFLCGSHRCVLWERAYKVVGMEDLMAAFLTDPEFARKVLHRIMDFQLGIAKHYISVGVEMISCSEDLGTQRGPLLSPDILDEFLIPEYRRLFEFYRKHGVIIDFHSCGSSAFLIEPLIDLGVNILNPIQATANDLDAIRTKTQGRLALMGGVSSATIMDGPVEKIRAEAVECMWQLGRDGGYFCRWDQGLPFPDENLAVFHDVVAQYGVYPLRKPPDQATGTATIPSFR